MTTKAQKANEERYVKMLLDGLTDYSAIEAGERPDFWVRRITAPDLVFADQEVQRRADQEVQRS
jgi:hypothetical protein